MIDYLLQLKETYEDNENKLLAYAKANNLKISLVDEIENNYLLPGKPLTPEQLTQLITNSRKSGIILMSNAQEMLRNNNNKNKINKA